MSALLVRLRPPVLSRRRLRHLGGGTVVVATIAFGGGVLWHHTVAGESRAPEEASRAAEPLARNPAVGPAYDLAAIDADPDYYGRADASRISQVAPLTAGQLRHDEILIIGDPFHLALPNSWLEQPLVVQAKLGRPVTFLALDSGTFENDQHTITVKADGQGLAAARFHVTNLGHYRVLAGSPENTGPAKFSIRCVTKKFRDDLLSGRYAQQYLAKEGKLEAQRRQAAADVAERIRRQSVTDRLASPVATRSAKPGRLRNGGGEAAAPRGRHALRGYPSSGERNR